MRTVPFRSVFDTVVRLHGRNARAEVGDDMRDALVDHINDRVRTICQCWNWPEWTLTEERAYRQVWNQDHQYLRISAVNGQPDEVFYIPTLLYYRVGSSATADPPVGSVPTDTIYWEQIDPVDTFIAYDQVCKRSIGMVLGVYSQNPRVPTGSANGLLLYRPSERGVDVVHAGTPTVFLNYKMPIPKYTMVPYVVGKIYDKGDVAFDTTIGETFQALSPTTALPADTGFWRRVPFPDVWADYVSKGAFADSLMEFDQGGNTELQVKMLMSQYWGGQADDSLQSEVDQLVAQGQRLQWNFCKRHDHWCDSQPWSGGTVSTLTDVCEDELGWVYPTPSVVPQVTWQYYNQVVALRATTATPSLDQVATRNLLPHSLAQIVIIESGHRIYRMFELVVGSANPLDPDGQVQPLDHDVNNNNKYWSSLQ